MVEVCFLLRKVLISSTLLSQFNSNTNYQNLGRIYTSINSLDHSNIHHTVGVFPFYHPVDFKSMSITFYIKNNGELIGMLCLNTDTTIITNFMKAAQQFVGCLPMGVSMTMGETITGSTTMVEENLDVPIVSFAESIISKTIADSNIPPERMTRQEKMEIVWELTNQGIPRMKGAISEIAKQLELSESTVYRYISLKED